MRPLIRILALALSLSPLAVAAQASPFSSDQHNHDQNHEESALVHQYSQAMAEVIELGHSQGLEEEFLRGIKIWPWEETLQVSAIWKNGEEDAITLYFMCHVHGDHFDCHKQSRPGPDEVL